MRFINMSSRFDVIKELKDVGLTATNAGIISKGEFAVTQELEFEGCNVDAVFIITYRNQNIVTKANAEIEYVVGKNQSKAEVAKRTQIIQQKLQKCCRELIGKPIEEPD